MDTIINIGSIETDVENNIISVTLVDGGTPIITLIQETVDIQLNEVGFQGPPGARGQRGVGIEYVWYDTKLGIKTEEEISYNFAELKGNTGNNLVFEDLTEQQKLELRGDVGNTSTNYTNLFNSVLLS